MKPLIQRITADAETIGELFGQLVEDVKRFVHAEIEYYRLMAVGRVKGLTTAAILAVVALLLVQASLTTLLIGIGLGIVTLFQRVGVAGGVLIAAVFGLVVSAILIRIAIGRISSSGEPAK